MNLQDIWREKGKAHRLGSEAFWVFLGQIGAAAAGLLGVKILTSVLIPAEFGRLALANTLVALITANLFGPVGQGLMRYWPICRDRGDLGIFYPVANRIGRYAIAISVSFIIGLVVVSVAAGAKNWFFLIFIALVAGAVTGWMSLRISVFMAARERRLVALLKIGNASLRPVIAALFVLMIAVSASWAMFGYALAAIIMAITANYYYIRNHSSKISFPSRKDNPFPLNTNLRKEILSFSYPFLIWGIFGWAHLSCDRWALQTYHGAEIVGAFAVVSQLATFPLIFGSGFLSALFSPIAYQRAGDLLDHRSVSSAYKILGAMTGLFILGAGILIALFGLFHRPLVLLISNINFMRFSYLLPGLAAAWAFYYLGQILCSFGLLDNKPGYYILPKLVTSIIALVLTFSFSARSGAAGVMWGLLFAGFVYAVWCALILWRLIAQKRRTNAT